MSFKLLAIRPTENCGKRHLKNLEINHLYKFYNDYCFKEKDNQVVKITNKKSIPQHIYNQGKVNINISAVVGKNGSGKSSLIDLFIASINQLSLALKKESKLNTNAVILSTKKGSVKNEIHSEIIYEINEEFFSLKIDDETILLKNINKGKEVDFKLDNFFYNQIVSYSIFSFNSLEMGDWIDNLFHKNDSYQIPIVITPKRERKNDELAGIININNENYLLRQRLLSIILSEPNYEITQNLKTKYLKLSLKEVKDVFYIDGNLRGGEIDKKNKISNNITLFYKVLNNPKYSMLYENGKILINNSKEILKEFKDFFKIKDVNSTEIQYKLDNYILRKISVICERYLSYGFLQKETTSYTIDIKSFLKKMNESHSHITLKLRQIVNFIKNYKIWETLISKKGNCIDVGELSKVLNKETDKKTSLIELLPPPIFDVELYSESKINILDNISSGERQFIHSTSTIIYHLLNIDSVEKDDLLVKYKHVNIILDEIELYFHPQFQKEFIKRLLENIKNLNLKDAININVLILSHSPFILSDIPNQNVLFLEQGTTAPQKVQLKKTFAGNISTLFSDSFFIEDGLIGSYAKEKINDLINYINTDKEDDKEKEEYFNLIKIIDEPVLKMKLMGMFSNKFPEFVKKKHTELKEQKVIEFAKKMGVDITIK